MPKLKAKKTEDADKVVDTNTADEEYMNEAEAEILAEDGKEYSDAQTEVSSQRMQTVLDLLQDEFDIRDKGFELTGYADKGNKIVATVSNAGYDVQFTLKSTVLLRLGNNN